MIPGARGGLEVKPARLPLVERPVLLALPRAAEALASRATVACKRAVVSRALAPAEQRGPA